MSAYNNNPNVFYTTSFTPNFNNINNSNYLQNRTGDLGPTRYQQMPVLMLSLPSSVAFSQVIYQSGTYQNASQPVQSDFSMCNSSCFPSETLKRLLAVEANHREVFRYENKVKATMKHLSDLLENESYRGINSTAVISLLAQNELTLKKLHRQMEEDLNSIFNLCINGLLKDEGKPLNQSENYHHYFVCLFALLNAIKLSVKSEKSSITTNLVEQFIYYINRIINWVASDLQKLSRFLFQQPQHQTSSQRKSTSSKAATSEQSKVDRFQNALDLLRRLLSEDFIPGLGLQVWVSTMDELFTAFLPFWAMKGKTGYEQFASRAVDFVQHHLLFSKDAEGGKERLLKSSFLPILLTAHLRLLHQLSTEPLQMIEKLFGAGNILVNCNFNLDGSQKKAIDLTRWLLTELWTMLSEVLNCMAVLAPSDLGAILTGSSPAATKATTNNENSDSHCATLNQLFLQLHLLWKLYKQDPSSEDNSNVLCLYLVQKGNSITNRLIGLLISSLGHTIWNYFVLVHIWKGMA